MRSPHHLTPTRCLVCLSLLLLIALGAPIAAQDSGAPPAREAAPAEKPEEATFQVVINADNPTAEMAASRIARIFLKKLRRWDNDVRARPVNLGAKSPTRAAFTRSVHGKSVSAIQSLWQRYVFAGRDEPPPEMASEQEVLGFVLGDPGAIGYVAAGVELPDGVKELKIIP